MNKFQQIYVNTTRITGALFGAYYANTYEYRLTPGCKGCKKYNHKYFDSKKACDACHSFDTILYTPLAMVIGFFAGPFYVPIIPLNMAIQKAFPREPGILIGDSSK